MYSVYLSLLGLCAGMWALQVKKIMSARFDDRIFQDIVAENVTRAVM